MNQNRIKILNKLEKVNSKSVVYVMSRDQRSENNFALWYALETANALELPTIVIFNLYKSVKNRTINHYNWMLTGLKEVSENLKKYNIKFYITEHKTPKQLAELIESEFNPYSILFDFSPLKGPIAFKEKFVEHSKSTCVVVDTHNIIPIWMASLKEEYGAYTLRPKIKKILKDYFEPASLKESKYTFDEKVSKDFLINVNIEDLLTSVIGDKVNSYNPIVKSGESAAKKELKHFIEDKLIDYANTRNNPNFDSQSNLSAYLHFGQLSSLTAAIEVLNYCYKQGVEPNFGFKEQVKDFDVLTDRHKLRLGAEAFLEELIVRKELADNYCYYNKNYDSLKGVKDWARKTLAEHTNNERENIYSLKELEYAKTNDEAWNAAQNQLIKTGKIHGYMRMYWAKRLLEWTNTPDDAVAYLIYLNDKYHLDGYDPNGYVGILWSIGGLHDRVWFERPIFGQIRYMNSNGLARKFDLKKYTEKWNQTPLK